MSLSTIAIALLLLQSPALIVIQGTVVDEGGGRPISKAAVELQQVNADGVITRTTADDGQFVFRGIPRGQYRLTAIRAGFVTTTIDVEQFSGIRFSVPRAGAISGHVSDGTGQPVINATVQALVRMYRNGVPTLRVEQTTTTNDRGEYRLYDLRPSQYFVSAMPAFTQLPAGYSTPFEPPSSGTAITFSGGVSLTGGLGNVGLPSLRIGGRERIAAPAYFPEAVAIASGSDVGGIDFSIVDVPRFAIRGIVVNRATDNQYVFVRFAQSPVFRSTLGFAVDRDNGSFHVANVIPGSYVLLATADDLTGRLHVEVRGADLDVEVHLTPGIDVSGRVVFEGARPPGMRVRLQNEPFIPEWEWESEPIDADGRFVLKDVPPGDYHVSVSSLPDDAYIKGLNTPIHLEGAAAQTLNITIGSPGGAVEGLVSGRATIAIVPEVGRQSKSAVTDASGRFRIMGLAPGDYKVFAWKNVEPGAWENADFLGPFEQQGIAVRVQEGVTETVVPIVNP